MRWRKTCISNLTRARTHAHPSRTLCQYGSQSGYGKQQSKAPPENEGVIVNLPAASMARDPRRAGQHGLQYVAHFYMGSVKNVMTVSERNEASGLCVCGM